MSNIEPIFPSAALCKDADAGKNEESDSVFSCLSDKGLTVASRRVPRLRLQSDESHESDSSKAASLGYSDSGHYSSANISDCQPLATPHDVIRQKDQALFLALQDVRRLRSELERLSNSERWYKQELRQQKHARLQALEKLYGNERTYIQENQRLQRECLRLYARCGEVESELEQQRVKQASIAQQKNVECSKESAGANERDFENEQQRALITDQQKLIEVLRKQKRALLADLQRLNEDKDALIYDLQKHLSQLEEENLRMTKKCKSLLEERNALKETLTKLTIEIQEQKNEQEKVKEQLQITELALETQQNELRRKENEIQDCKCNFKNAMQDELDPDAIHQLSVDYHKEIIQKTNEITTLKQVMHAMENELDTLLNVQGQSEQQQHEIEELSVALREKDYELSELQASDSKKSAEIVALKEEISEYVSMTRSLAEQWEQHKKAGDFAEMLCSQDAARSAEAELIAANERYANMCALCERTRFALELREIEVGKLHFERNREADDVMQLREKLSYYLQQTEELSKKIVELELKLSHGNQVKDDAKKQGVQSICEDYAMCGGSTEEFLINKISQKQQMDEDEFNKADVNESGIGGEDLDDLKTKYDSEISSNRQNEDDFLDFYVKPQETNEYIKELEDENLALKSYIDEMLALAKVEIEADDKEEECEQPTEAAVTIFRNICSKQDGMTNFYDRNLAANKCLEAKNDALEQIGVDEVDAANIHVKTKDITFANFKFNLLESNHSEADKETMKELCIGEKAVQKHAENTEAFLKRSEIESAKLVDSYKRLPGVEADSSQRDDSDFKKLNSKILEMQNFIENLQEQNQDLVQQLEDFSDQAVAEEPTSRKRLQEIKVLNEALDTLVEEKQELLTKIAEITKLNTENVQAYESTALELLQTKEEIKKLQSKLLQTDAKLYKMEKAKSSLDDESRDIEKLAEFEKLHKELLSQLESMQQQQQRLQHELDQREQRTEESQIQLKQQNFELQQKLQVLESKIEEQTGKELKKLNKEEGIKTHLNDDNDCTAQILKLREKTYSLEQQLQEAHQQAEQQRSDRVELLQKLLQQQNHKVSQINAAQADWEQLLKAVNDAQAEVIVTSSALEQKQLEFQELNERFTQQNLELQSLHKAKIKQDCKMHQELQALRQTCQQQTAAIEEQAKRVENLELKNVELFRLNNDQRAIEANLADKCEMIFMREQLKNMKGERDETAARMHRMEKELSELRKTKREAIFVPKRIAFPSTSAASREVTGESAEESSQENITDHLRILTKVLEHEYKSRMKSYDLQVSRLSGIVKHLKRALSAEKDKVTALKDQRTSDNLQLQELQSMRNQLLDARQRYEQSQNIAKSLQTQLDAVQYKNGSTGREFSSESEHEVPNLIDDYKKLIQQSSAMSKRPRSSTILDLIERSNRSAPQLHKLESSIQELRQDIQQYIGVSQSLRSRQSYFSESYKQPSLLDELKQAAAAYA